MSQLLHRLRATLPPSRSPERASASSRSEAARQGRAERPPSSADHGRELKFARRIHLLRSLGLGLGFFCVASVLRLQDASAAWWVLLVINGFVWPHAALLHATQSASPHRAEQRNLVIDSTMGGLWVAVMQFNLLPSVLLVTMLSVDKVSVGGGRLLLRTSVFLVAACLLTAAALGFEVHLQSPMSVVVACVPFLMVYPLAISKVTHGLAREVARANRRLLEVGRTDELTGLGNRRQGFAVAEAELARHRRTGRPAVLVVLDIDHFKRINDRYGHPIGDEVLRSVATVLCQCTRATDTPARYGGDEFLIVLPEADLHSVSTTTQRIRERLAALAFDRHPDLRCTLSFGIAEAHRDMIDVEDWMQQADAALYRAKAAGRDCVIAAPALVGAV